MAVKVQFPRSTDGGPQISVVSTGSPLQGQGLPLFNGGVFYLQNIPTAAVTNTSVSTSLLDASVSNTVGFFTQDQAGHYPGSVTILPPNFMTNGTMFEVSLIGTIAAPGASGLTITTVLASTGTAAATYTLVNCASTSTASVGSSAFEYSSF